MVVLMVVVRIVVVVRLVVVVERDVVVVVLQSLSALHDFPHVNPGPMHQAMLAQEVPLELVQQHLLDDVVVVLLLDLHLPK